METRLTAGITNTPVDGVRSRALTRGFLVALVGLIAAGGAWGAVSEFQAATDGNWPSTALDVAGLAGVGALLAVGVADCVLAFARLAGYRRRQERAQREELVRLSQAALSDSLTGLGNHRAFHEDLRREIERRARAGSCFSVVMLDLDGLKRVNDTLGHQVGDSRIRATAECIRATMRGSDAAYRTGGDEFMVLLPNERAWGAFMFCQRLQREVEDHADDLAVTCGLAESAGFESADTLVRRADVALYDAKRSHRRIVIYTPGLAASPSVPAAEHATLRHHRLLATALARAVDAKDADTRNHCETVSTLCVLIAQTLGLEPARVERLRLAGLLHDVGKIGVPDGILQKPGLLDEDEWNEIRAQVRVGQSIVAAAGLDEEAEWVLHHHEHFDGSGYPSGLRGDQIPLESRIILVADAFEAMTAAQPYGTARPSSEAIAELGRLSGKQFDPTCVDALRLVVGTPTLVRVPMNASSGVHPDSESQVSLG